MAETTWYVSYCPLADKCNRSNRRLGSDPDPDAARQRVVHHLTRSSYHLLSSDEANGFAEVADLEEEQWQPSSHAQSHDDAAGHTKGGKSGNHAQRSGPYSGGAAVAAMSKAVVEAVQSALSSAGQAPPLLDTRMQLITTGRTPTMHERLVTCISRAEAAARTSARMARSAATAFEEEAGHLRDCLEQLSRT